MIKQTEKDIDFHWDVGWCKIILILACIIAPMSIMILIQRFNEEGTIPLSISLLVGSIIAGVVCFYLLRNPPLHGRITQDHLLIEKRVILWEHIVCAEMVESRKGGSYSVNIGITLTDAGRKLHPPGPLSVLHGVDLFINGEFISDFPKFLDEVNLRSTGTA